MDDADKILRLRTALKMALTVFEDLERGGMLQVSYRRFMSAIQKALTATE